MSQHHDISLDIGSTCIKAVAFDEKGDIRARRIFPLKRTLIRCLEDAVDSFLSSAGISYSIRAFTGSGCNLLSEHLGCAAVSELSAVCLGAGHLCSYAGSVLEIGAEHAKFIRLESSGTGDNCTLKDFRINSVCSAGTGTFLSQEAHRFNLTHEAFSRLAAETNRRVRIAGRCAVFSKTDMVHHHQNGVPLSEIVNGLCFSIAQNIAADLIGNRLFDLPLLFIGGVAANEGIQKALTEILGIKETSLIIPDDYRYANAVGAYLYNRQIRSDGRHALGQIKAILQKTGKPIQNGVSTLKPLSVPDLINTQDKVPRVIFQTHSACDQPVIGIDIGSTTTNLVTMSSAGEIIDKTSLLTQGRALDAVCKALHFIREKEGPLQPKAVGITGSGRALAGRMIGADFVVDEITAHAAGGRYFSGDVDTIFDIGGQDAKYIRLKDNHVLDFEMNKLCSAGTGSFLEEMSELLGLDIVNDFAREAMRSRYPAGLSERCTVFMGSELMRKLQEGYLREDLVAGLCYAVVKNYLSRVVGRRPIGDKISFQGGVAGNQAIIAAMGHILNKPVFVHEHHEAAGAIGAALLARDRMRGKSRFEGFSLSRLRNATTRSFECGHCNNQCIVHSVSEQGGKVFYSGGLCGRYDTGRSNEKDAVLSKEPDWFQERDDALMKQVCHYHGSNLIGIPRALHFYELLPFWAGFFNALQVPYKVSGGTTKEILWKGSRICPSNPCMPVKAALGHCVQLLDEAGEPVFIPWIPNLHFRTRQERLNHICPFSQSWPFLAGTLLNKENRLLTPMIRFSIPHFFKHDITEFGRSLGFGNIKIKQAIEEAFDSQYLFYQSMRQSGKRLLRNLDEGKKTIVILSRPYSICDPYVLSRLKKIFRDLDIVPVPMDMIDDSGLYSHELEGMYWYFGKRILQAAERLCHHKKLAAIFLSNYRCGSDAFIVHFLRKRLTGTHFLELEIDEHHDFTGMNTRVEAFVHSINGPKVTLNKRKNLRLSKKQSSLENRLLLIPRMSDHAFAFASAFKLHRVNAEVLPFPDADSISLGRSSVGGQECCPCYFVIGDMLRYLSHDHDRTQQPTFFMISGDGPCRLGQYPFLQHLILEEKGYNHADILDASQDQSFYERFGIKNMAFKRMIWKGTVAIDLLLRKWRECRPYIQNQTDFDLCYNKELAAVSSCIENHGNLRRTLMNAMDHLGSFRKENCIQKPVIAVLGENYVRCNPAANAHIADSLESLGAEVWFPSLYEWVYYTNWTAQIHCLYEKQILKYLKMGLMNAVQHMDAFSLASAARRKGFDADKVRLSKIFKNASKYVPRLFEGETVIEIGRTIDYYNKGVSGVIHVIPFGCIAGSIVETFSQKISQNLNGFPILTMEYDGRSDGTHKQLLEGFMIRAIAWDKEHNKVQDSG